MEGIEAKLDRAEAQMDFFDAYFPSWISKEEPWGAERQVDEGKRRYIIIFRELKPIPALFSVMDGETVHNMRSALDHLAGYLVKRSGGKVTNSTAWPIKKSRAAWRRHVERRRRPSQLWRKKGGGPLKGIPFHSDAWTLIERSQPYVRSDNVRNDPLWGLEEFWNTDKHRLLNANPIFTDPDSVLSLYRPIPDIPPIEARSLVRSDRALKDGAKLALYRFPLDQPLPEMKMHGKLPVQIAIGDDDRQERPLLRDTLKIIRQIVAEAKAL